MWRSNSISRVLYPIVRTSEQNLPDRLNQYRSIIIDYFLGLLGFLLIVMAFQTVDAFAQVELGGR